MTPPEDITYKDAGVDTHKAQELVKDIGALRARTEKKRQLTSSFGLFAAGFDLSEWKQPVLFTGCDGVGTKMELLLEHDLPEVAGVDLVGMSVNDVLTCNAAPVLFLDYLGIAQLDNTLLARLVAGMVDALEACDCILAGGETAEMPGMVPEGTVELSGFCIGVAEKEDVIDPTTVAAGDVIFGIASDGIHANGFSLVRRILSEYADDFSQEDIKGLLTATRLYHGEVDAVRTAGLRPHAMAHITGGGIRENLPRVLGELGAELTLPAWDNPPVQKLISKVSADTAVHTFNMGIGYMFVMGADDVAAFETAVPHATRLGTVTTESGVRITLPSGEIL